MLSLNTLKRNGSDRKFGLKVAIYKKQKAFSPDICIRWFGIVALFGSILRAQVVCVNFNVSSSQSNSNLIMDRVQLRRFGHRVIFLSFVHVQDFPKIMLSSVSNTSFLIAFSLGTFKPPFSMWDISLPRGPVANGQTLVISFVDLPPEESFSMPIDCITLSMFAVITLPQILAYVLWS